MARRWYSAAMFLWLAACASGTINYPTGSDRIRTAYFATEDDPAWDNVRQAVVLLANSDVSCNSIPSFDESAMELDEIAEVAAFTREDARVVVLYLYQRRDAEWTSQYDLLTDHSGEFVTTSKGVAGAAYLGVEEAALLDDDGLQRFYQPGSNPGDCMLLPNVGEPGSVEITRDGNDKIGGSFSLEGIDVSGHFTAERCSQNPTFVETFQSIALFGDRLSMCVVEDDDNKKE